MKRRVKGKKVRKYTLGLGCSLGNKNVANSEQVDGKPVRLEIEWTWDYSLFLYVRQYDGCWRVGEETTGLAINGGGCTTQKAAIERAEYTLNRHGHEVFKGLVEKHKLPC